MQNFNSTVIQGDKVRTIRQVVETEVPLSEFLNKLSSSSPILIPFLPNCTKAVASFSNDTVFIIEQMPRTQDIRFKTSSIESNLKVHFPYVYYLITMQNNPPSLKGVNILTSQKPIYNKDSVMGYFPMPNMQHFTTSIPSLCLGEIRAADNMEMHAWINDFINKIITSEYNSDLNFCPIDYIPEVMTKAMEKYGKRALAEKDESPIAKAYIRIIDNGSGDLERYWKYMYAWHKLTESMSISDFLKELTYPHPCTYQSMLDKLDKVIQEF